jgi:4-carboxymuconolactone decarboxylase
MTTNEERGLDIIQTLFKQAPTSDGVNTTLRDFSVKHLFGEVWARPQLSLRDRELITLAALATGGWERQLRIHIVGALNVGVTREEVIEIFTHIAYYAGYPAGFTALGVAREVFEAMEKPKA